MKMKNSLKKITHNILRETLEDRTDEIMEKLKFNKPGESFDYVEEGETCEQCGSEMTEGECMECGGMRESECMECGGEMREGECMECGMREGEILEKLYGGQKKLDKAKPYGKLTKADFDKLRKEGDDVIYELEIDEEMDESSEFSYAARMAKKEGKKSFELDGKKFPVKESQTYNLQIDGDEILLSESELDELILKVVEKEKNNKNNLKYKLEIGGRGFIVSEEKLLDIIESIVLKEENNISKGKTPKGYGEYERVVKKSKSENDNYLKSVKKKMSDYLKDGSKGEYTESPKFFPKGNGQLEKMKAKKYTMSDDGNEFLNDYMRPGMENLVPDEIEYDEDWVKDNIEGSSRTGNNPEWANAEETDLGKKLNKKLKDRKYNKAKMAAYRKSKQPVTDGTGENSGSGLNIKLESDSEKKLGILAEEFSKIQKLISYDKRTQ
jgi:hypothetical protein